MQMLKGDESGDTGRVWPIQPGARLLHGINIHVNKKSSNKYQHTENILNYNYHGKSGRVVPRSRVEK